MGFIPTDEHLQAPGNYIDEAGRYTLKINAIENIISGNGNPGYKLNLSCVESGATMNDTLYETAKAFWKICLFAKSCGVQIARGSELTIDDSYIGKTFVADVILGKPNAKGDVYPEIKEFGPGPHDSLFLPDGATPPATAATPAPKKTKW
jgi:hypothetical protein